MGSSLSPKFSVSMTYLITRRSSLYVAGFAPLFALDNSLVALAIYLVLSASPGTEAFLRLIGRFSDLQHRSSHVLPWASLSRTSAFLVFYDFKHLRLVC